MTKLFFHGILRAHSYVLIFQGLGVSVAIKDFATSELLENTLMG